MFPLSVQTAAPSVLAVLNPSAQVEESILPPLCPGGCISESVSLSPVSLWSFALLQEDSEPQCESYRSLFQHGVQLKGQVVKHVADVIQDVHGATGPGRAEELG